MKQPTLILVIALLVLVAGLVTAGCTQSSSSTSPSSGNPAAPDSGSGAGNDRQNTGQAGAGPDQGSGHQSRGPGQGFMNESRISAAAAALGISEDALSTALNSTANSTTGRPDFAAAAQQLGFTEQQLTGAFGFPQGGSYNGTRMRGNGTGTPGQETGGQQPPQE